MDVAYCISISSVDIDGKRLGLVVAVLPAQILQDLPWHTELGVEQYLVSDCMSVAHDHSSHGQGGREVLHVKLEGHGMSESDR